MTSFADAAAIVAQAFADGLRPEPELSVCEWADRYRIVGKPSPEPGPWSTDRVPYAREIMESLSPSSPVEIVALMKAAQGAGTEIGLNAVGCWMHLYPDSTMIVQPTVDAAKKFSRIRLDRMFEASPVLRDLVAEPRSRNSSNTISLKEFGPARDTLILTGANSGVGLRSYPSRYVLADEIDGYPSDVDGEGDPIDLIMQRTGAFRNRKLFLLSTPTLEESSNINRWYLAGDQRQFEIPCPLCGYYQALIWYKGEDQPGGVRWPKGRPDLARYQCEACGDQWEEWRKVEVMGYGEWVPRAPGVGGGAIRSYQINALYYPFGWPENKWVNLAARWERDHVDPVRLKTFVNLKLGQPWKDQSEVKTDADTLMLRREAYGATVPAGVAVLTAGVDIQPNRIELELVGWGRDEESWSVDQRVFLGDTAKPHVWEELDSFLKQEWRSDLGVKLSIRATCVDTGYATQIATQFCYARLSRRIWPIKGKDGQRSIWPRKISKQRGKYPPPFIVGVDAAKENIYARLKIEAAGPGYCHFPHDRDRDWFDQLLAEVRVPNYSGPQAKYQWKKKTAGAKNEALDCRVYAYAALCGLSASTAFRLNVEADKLNELAAVTRGEAEPKPKRLGWKLSI